MKPAALDTMGDIYYQMGEPDAAIAKYEEALQVKPDFSPSYKNISYLYALKEDYDKTRYWTDKWMKNVRSAGSVGE